MGSDKGKRFVAKPTVECCGDRGLWSKDNQARLTKAPVVTKGKAPSPGSAVSEKVRTRLEELDDLEEVCLFKCQMCIPILNWHLSAIPFSYSLS